MYIRDEDLSTLFANIFNFFRCCSISIFLNIFSYLSFDFLFDPIRMATAARAILSIASIRYKKSSTRFTFFFFYFFVHNVPFLFPEDWHCFFFFHIKIVIISARKNSSASLQVGFLIPRTHILYSLSGPPFFSWKPQNTVFFLCSFLNKSSTAI